MIPTHALTVRQPWASLIVAGVKPIENRGWLPGSDPDGPRTIAIHADQQTDQSAPSWAWNALPYWDTDLTGTYGNVLGIVTYAGAHRAPPARLTEWDGPQPQGCGCGRWGHAGCWHWQLTDPTPLPVPFAATGRLGLWPINPTETDRNHP